MCHLCEARPIVITSPKQGANVYRDGRDPSHRANKAKATGVESATRREGRRFSRNTKHSVGGPFVQRCLVCDGGAREVPAASKYVVQQDREEAVAL